MTKEKMKPITPENQNFQFPKAIINKMKWKNMENMYWKKYYRWRANIFRQSAIQITMVQILYQKTKFKAWIVHKIRNICG